MFKIYMSELNFYLHRTIGHRFWRTLQLFSYLTTAIEERVDERRLPIFWHQIKSLETQNVQIFPFVNLIYFCSYKSLFLNNECLL